MNDDGFIERAFAYIARFRACRLLVGGDTAGGECVRMVRKREIGRSGVVADPDRPTTVKTRVIAHQQQVVRVDREKKEPPDGKARGMLASRVLAALGEARGAALGGGDVGGAGEVWEGGKALLRKTGAGAILITRGEEGMSLVERGRRSFFHIASQGRQVFDVTGAGDTVIGTLARGVGGGSAPAGRRPPRERGRGGRRGRGGNRADYRGETDPGPAPAAKGEGDRPRGKGPVAAEREKDCNPPMSLRTVPSPARLLFSVMYREERDFERSLRRITERMGAVGRVSDPFPFDRTDYYEREMGSPLFRRFLFYVDAVSRDELAAAKLAAGGVERELL